MANLKFADTHNMVAFLSKPEESDGFEQIVDFLNAHPIKYALTVNPTIYISCIEQFWSTVKAKTINGEIQLHALVDGKKIIITESTVRRDLQLEDAEGVDCLPNSTIFEQLTLMGSKTTAWNEFSSTMASAIICLATNQKFNFSKYIFESMIRNLDNLSGKFLMYPRNMRRVGKGFSGRVTPLFPTMMVQNQSELGEGSANPTDPHHTPTIIQSSTQPQKTQKPRKPKRKDTQVPQPSDPSENVADEAVHKELGDSLVRAATTASSLEAEQDSGNITKTRSKATPNESSSLGTTSGGGPRCQETMGDTIAQTRHLHSQCYKREDMFDVNDLDGDEVIVDNASTIPVSAATTTTTTTAIITDVEITLAQALAELKSAKPKAVKIVIQEPEQGTTTTTPTTIIFVPKPPQDKGKGIMIEEPMVEQVKPMKRLEQIRLDEEIAFKLQVEEEEEEERFVREKAQQTEEANIAWDDVQAKIEANYYKEENILQLRAEEKRNRPPTSIMCTYLKNIEGWKPKNLKNKSFTNIQELFDKAMKRSSSKRAGDELEQENAKKQKVDEDKETSELQSLIEVVPVDEEEVAIDAKWDPTRSILQLGQQFGIDIPVRVSHAHCADIVMSDLEDSTVTYTEVSSPFEELLDIGSPRVVVYGYDGLLIHPPSLDYVPGLEELAEEQPLPAALSPTADSPWYIIDFDTKEDPKEDPADYPANEGDNDDDDVEENEDKEEEEHPALTDLLGIIFEFIRQNKNETRRS
ncbi:hypothetical protein Tco_0162974 [Tanacetum coccineum]